MPLHTTAKRCDEGIWRSIYEQQPKRVLVDFILREKAMHNADIPLPELRGMTKEELIQYLVQIKGGTNGKS